MSSDSQLVYVEPVEGRPEFRLMVPSGEMSEGATLFDLAGEGEGSEGSVSVSGLVEMRDSLQEWLDENGGDSPRSGEVRAVLGDLEKALDSVEWDSDQKAVFRVGDWGVLYGKPDFLSSSAISEGSEVTLESDFAVHLVAFKPKGRVEARRIRSALRDGGVTIAGHANILLGGGVTSIEQVKVNAAAAREAGFALPAELEGGLKLEAHQAEAALSLAYTGGGLLADQVGLGKSVEFVSAWESYRARRLEEGEKVGPCVVLTTQSMRSEIAEEIIRWSGRDPKVFMLSGRSWNEIDEDVDYILLHYHILASHWESIAEMRPSGFIADECHLLKSPDAQWSKAAGKLVKSIRSSPANKVKGAGRVTRGSFVCMVSGTPFLNRPLELWHPLSLLDSANSIAEEAMKYLPERTVYWRRERRGRVLGDWKSNESQMTRPRAFQIRFCGGHYDHFHAWHNQGATNTEELNELLVSTANMVRRRKSDVLSPLPHLGEHVIEAPLDEGALSEYNEAAGDFVSYYLKEAQIKAIKAGESVRRALLMARQRIDASSAMVRIGALREIASRGKAGTAVEWIESFLDGEVEVADQDGDYASVSADPTRRKLVVFTHFRATRAQIMQDERLARFNPVYILPGSEMKESDIQEAKRRFQEDDETRLIICSMAAREGHTLTAAKDVLVVDMPFGPSWVVQMAGRCWARFSREFAPHEAYVHYMISPGTVDERIMARSRLKRSMFDAVIDNEGLEELAEQEELDEAGAAEMVAGILEGILPVGIAR